MYLVCVYVCGSVCVCVCGRFQNEVTQKSNYPRTGILQISVHSKNDSTYTYEKVHLDGHNCYIIGAYQYTRLNWFSHAS